MALLKFLKGNYANLGNKAISEGQILVCGDTGELFVDVAADKRVKIGDFITVANIAALEALDATKVPTSRLYYVEDGNILARSNGTTWVQVNKQKTADEMKTFLGLGSMAYVSEVTEANLSAELAEKVNAASEGNHAHLNKAELDKVADGDVEKWGEAYTHSQAAHAPANAQANVIESVKVNGTALEITDKTVDITVPTGALAGKDKVAKTDLDDTLANEIDNKVVKEDGKSLVADTEITKLAGVSEGANKVEASTNGKIKIDGVDTTVYTHPESHIVSEISDFAVEVAKVKVDNAGHADTAGNATSADSAKKVENALTVKVGGADVVFDGSEAKTADVDAAIEAAIDAIPAQTDYTVTITENTNDTTVAKTYVFSQCGAEIGAIKLAKELVVTSGSVKEVETADAPYAGAKVGDKYIELVIANQDAPIYVPAKDLVDIYTAKDGATEVQVAISNTNEISATLVNGGVTEEKLAEAVKTKLNKTWEEVGVAKGLVDALADGQVKTNKEAIDAINNESTGILKQAKDYADGLASNYAEAEHTHTASEITDFATEVAKVKVDEATKATQDGNGKVIADTYAEKATTLEGYGITDAYTKTETEALLTWGEF